MRAGTGTGEGEEVRVDPLVIEFQGVGRYLMWVQGNELRSPE